MNLLIFLTRGYNLNHWKENGTLKRELSFYKLLENKNYKITFLSYGTEIKDRSLLKKTNFKILNRPMWVPVALYSFLIPLIHFKALKKTNIIKTNQIFGTLEAFFCCIIFNKSLYSRSGYIPSSKISYLKLSLFSKALIFLEEFIACRYSKTISVSSKYAIKHLSKKYKVKKKKFKLLYNFVDPIFFSSFKSKKNNKKILDICFVGRLVNSKQPLLLLEIIKEFKNINLHILGVGPLLKTLKKKSSKIDNKVVFYDRVENSQVSKFFKNKNVLLLPTLEEGNSKVILEAMSCGLIVMTNDIECNKELIKHKSNGYLIKRNDVGIYKSYLSNIIRDNKLKYEFSTKAFSFAKKKYNIKRFLNLELLQLKKCN